MYVAARLALTVGLFSGLCAAQAAGSGWPDPGGLMPPSRLQAPIPAPDPGGGIEGPSTGAWRVLVLIYRDTDADYGDQHASVSLTDAQVTLLQRGVTDYVNRVSEWSGSLGRVTVDQLTIDRPLTTVTPVFDDYFWITPDDTASEIEAAFESSEYDSVIALWHSGPIPTNYWGLAYVGPIYWRGSMFTWSTVLLGNSSWWNGDYPGEVILHEWLHGVEGLYRSYDYVVPDLHGAEDHGYREDPGGGWRTWLTDYMQGHVLRDGETHGISPGVWASGGVLNRSTPPPAQLLSPLPFASSGGQTALRWAGPQGALYQPALYNTADESPAYSGTTYARSVLIPPRALRTDETYRWVVTSQQDGIQKAAPEGRTFGYIGATEPYTVDEAASALRAFAGLTDAGAVDVGRWNLRRDGPSAGRLDLQDAAALLRKAAGLDPNP